MRLNVPITGFILGLVLPALAILGFYAWRGNHEGIGHFITSLTYQKGMAAKVVLLSVLVNLVPFTWFNMRRLDYAMRGVFMATMLYALLVIMLMFVW
jgi:hypothetical protein